MFDLIILDRYSNNLTSCDLQIGFKQNKSTDMCMMLKESVSHYVNNGSSVFCTYLDASKAFDQLHTVSSFVSLLNVACLLLLYGFYVICTSIR